MLLFHPMRSPGQSRLHAIPITWEQASQFVNHYHRHHLASRGQKWATGCGDETGTIVGVTQAGRPVARELDDGLILEVKRSCTNGFPNANSFLYGRAREIAFSMGYEIVITYIQKGESGVSLKAAGFRFVRSCKARKSWAESSVKLRHLRDPKGSGGIDRELWAAARIGWDRTLRRLGVDEEEIARRMQDR